MGQGRVRAGLQQPCPYPHPGIEHSVRTSQDGRQDPDQAPVRNPPVQPPLAEPRLTQLLARDQPITGSQ